jgi:acyl-CoA hydrolase
MRSISSWIKPGDTLVAGQTLGEPEALLDALFDSQTVPPGVRLFTGMSLSRVLTRTPTAIELLSFVGLGTNRELIAEGRMELVPCHMSDLPGLLTSGPLKADVALILVSPPDDEGNCSLGVSSDYIWPVANSATTVLAEINPHVPRVAGDTSISYELIDGFVHSDRPLPEQERAEPSKLELSIASRVTPYIHDGTCLQIGVGKLGEAILQSVTDRSDLGVHAGMVGDTILELMDEGVITNGSKQIDQGLTVGGSILGSSRSVQLADANPSLRLRSVEYTHDPGIISRLSDFLCVNSAIEVDVFGQVNSEFAAGNYVGAIGGAVDFLRGAIRSPGGRSIVALPSTARRGSISRVVPRVEHVTALGSDVDIIVTEYGTAELRGVSRGERARRIIELADPAHRDSLRNIVSKIDL